MYLFSFRAEIDGAARRFVVRVGWPSKRAFRRSFDCFNVVAELVFLLFVVSSFEAFWLTDRRTEISRIGCYQLLLKS